MRLGPPICDELLAFVRHVFSEEEASVARHLGLFRGRAAAAVAHADRRDLTQTALLLERLAAEKYVIASGGPPEQRRYYLPPIMPGMFEMALIGCTPDSLSDWHRHFIELFETLYETGYILDYQHAPGTITPFIRVIPVGKAIEAHPMALPSDKLEIVLDRFETFGIGQCQCRMTMQVARPRLRQAAGQLHHHGRVGRARHRRGHAAKRLEEKRAGNQTRGRVARAGHVDDER